LASTNESSFTVYYDSMVETKLKLKWLSCETFKLTFS
jgi:hypothetical protein